MIKLKSGREISYHDEFDVFFQTLLEAIVIESRDAAKKTLTTQSDESKITELILREVMDNCIYVTHQLFEIAKTNESLSKFMVTGFLFNSVVLSLSQMKESPEGDKKEDDKEIIH